MRWYNHNYPNHTIKLSLLIEWRKYSVYSNELLIEWRKYKAPTVHYKTWYTVLAKAQHFKFYYRGLFYCCVQCKLQLPTSQRKTYTKSGYMTQSWCTSANPRHQGGKAHGFDPRTPTRITKINSMYISVCIYIINDIQQTQCIYQSVYTLSTTFNNHSLGLRRGWHNNQQSQCSESTPSQC